MILLRLVRGLALSCATLVLTACAQLPAKSLGRGPAPLTVLISIDGFRADYLDRGITPNLSRLAGEGAHGAIRPSFPSKTFPNHYTLVTGLRPDHHGIVDNNMRDPDIPGVAFSLSNKAAVADAGWWNDGTPIWVTAERAGIASATMFWPGSEAAIQGVRPSLWLPFDQSMPAQARVDQVLAWLDGPKPPKLVTLYFDEVDTAGHNDGPQSEGLAQAVQRTDAAIGRLTEGLRARGLTANLVVVADHGMAPVAPDRALYLEDLLPKEAGRPQAMGAFMTYFPAPGREAEVEKALLARHPHMACWRKGEIPARYHFGTHRRIPPIFCLPQTGWEITTREFVARKPLKGGNHGFDPYAPEMAAVFVGHGPAFRRGVTTPLTDNVDVYPVLAKLLGVTPEANDGGETLADAALAR
jgi:predicted AlkP superfamily pyrophosphatase or phosphodiesterase